MDAKRDLYSSRVGSLMHHRRVPHSRTFLTTITAGGLLFPLLWAPVAAETPARRKPTVQTAPSYPLAQKLPSPGLSKKEKEKLAQEKALAAQLALGEEMLDLVSEVAGYHRFYPYLVRSVSFGQEQQVAGSFRSGGLRTAHPADFPYDSNGDYFYDRYNRRDVCPPISPSVAPASFTYQPTNNGYGQPALLPQR